MGATELTDLEVDRVDAVDRPATRRKFLIVKAEDGKAGTDDAKAADSSTAEPDQAKAAAEAKDLLEKSAGFLAELRKADGLTLPPAVAKAANALIDAIGDATITKFAEPKADDDKDTTSKAAAIDTDDLAAKIAKGVVDGIRKAAEADDTAAAPPRSAQGQGEPVAKAAPKKMGEGLFSNIVMGRV